MLTIDKRGTVACAGRGLQRLAGKAQSQSRRTHAQVKGTDLNACHVVYLLLLVFNGAVGSFRRPALDRYHLRPVLERIQIIGPSLHHFLALFHQVAPSISGLGFIAYGMG